MQQAKTPGQRIYKLRMQQGISQAELAKKVGTTEQNIQKLEIGMVPDPPFPDIYRIADVLNTNRGYILCWEPDIKKQPHLVFDADKPEPACVWASIYDQEDDDELPFEEYDDDHILPDTINEEISAYLEQHIEEIFNMPDTPDEKPILPSDYDETTFIPDWENDPFWIMQQRTWEECDQFIETGKFNNHKEGYLTIVMRLMGYPETEVNSMRMKLFNHVFGKVPAMEARKTGAVMGITVKHKEPKDPNKPAIIYQFPTQDSSSDKKPQ